MKKIFKWIAIGLLGALVIIQFIHPEKNSNSVIGPLDITRIDTVPANVQQILAKACNDCHSSNTRYPWYNNIQPVAWWLNDHINEGKHKLNFSEFGGYKLLKQAKRLKDIVEQIDEDEMPISSYTFIHKDAILTADEKKALTSWAKKLSDSLYAKVPPEEIEQDRKRREEKKKQKEANK